ncbi:MAG: DUF3179 domain-containing protein [Nitrospinota bacterium]
MAKIFTEKVRLVFLLGLVFFIGSGFDFSRHSIPLDDISDGGPGKDGIPSINHPRFLSVEEADGSLMKNADRVLGFVHKGQARAYPIKILNWHEIVNDRVGDKAIVVSFCPLCGTGMVFDAHVKKRNLKFGVSGLLYQSDMLLYDHETESLWSQIKSEAVTGPLTGTRLKLLASTHTNWATWKRKHPNTKVLSDKTGYRRPYDRNPYQGYEFSSGLMFDVDRRNARFHPKEIVIGIEIGGRAKAYPFSELGKSGSPVKDIINGVPVKIYYEGKSKTAVIKDGKNKELPSVVGYWFAWYVFHPKTKVFKTNSARK